MERYKNLGGNSNIINFEIGDDRIGVQFKGGKIYIFSYQRAGVDHVEIMKSLARSGRGLNAYINIHVKDDYDL